MHGKQIGLSLVGILAALFLAGCNAGSTSSGGSGGSAIGVSLAAAAATVDGTDATTLTATVTNDSSNAGVKFTSTVGTISGATTTGATFTAPAATSSAQTVTVTATSVTDTTKTGTATITVPAAPAITTAATSLAGRVGAAYSVTLAASGGISPYTWTATGVPSCLKLTSAGVLTPASGTTPLAGCAGTYSVAFKATDSGTSTALSASSTLSVAIAAATTISFGSAPTATGTVSTAYSSAVTATGGVGTLTYSVASGNLPVGLTLNPSTGAITGTPTTAAGSTFTVSASDGSGDTGTSSSYTITVSAPVANTTVSGTISLNGYCGGASPTLPTFTVALNTPTPMQTTTNSSGQYSFTGVPAGTYTITPSITGPSSVFFPATVSTMVTGTPVTGENFSAGLGYTVSGTISYGGSNTGPIYITLNNTSCSGNPLGINISTAGSYTIHGVPPGTYTLYAWMDTQGTDEQNASDPTGTSGSNPAVSTANVTGAVDTLIDPTVTAPSAGPSFNSVNPTDQGVAIVYGPVETGNVEAATSYDITWDTVPGFNGTPTTVNVKATGAGGTNVWFLNNGTSGISGNPFTDGTTYYFEARARNSAGHGPYAVFGGGTPTGVTVNPSSAGNAVSGAVRIPVGITPTGPLYIGFFDPNNGNAYVTRTGSPSTGLNGYTLVIPTGTSYIMFGFLDQNNDGVLDLGDVSNLTSQNTSTVSISGTTTNEDLTLPSTNTTFVVSTQYFSQTYQASGTTSNYNLVFNLRESNKLPVSARITSGPNLISPTAIDIGNCSNCGTPQFQYFVSTGSAVPNVGDSYNVNVTYSDATSETLTGVVTGWNGGGSVGGPADLPTSLSPTGTGGGSTPGGSTTPTLSWTDPSADSTDTFQFNLNDNNGNTIWQIPGQNSNSNSNGFANSITSLTWGTDPTGGGSTPSGSLSSSTVYSWSIQAQDSNNNQVTTQTWYQP